MTVSPFYNVSPATNSLAAVVAVNCELVRGTEAQVVELLLPRVKQESLALNLAAVERIDAAGIAALITLYCSAVEAGQDFSVINPSAHVLELLCLVGLEPILVATSRQEGAAPRKCYERTAA
jgi:anti-anti-sigma factor